MITAKFIDSVVNPEPTEYASVGTFWNVWQGDEARWLELNSTLLVRITDLPARVVNNLINCQPEVSDEALGKLQGLPEKLVVAVLTVWVDYGGELC